MKSPIKRVENENMCHKFYSTRTTYFIFNTTTWEKTETTY